MHVDVHGKLTRSDGYELDVGISCLQQHWNCKQYQEGYFTEAFEYQLKKQFDEILLKHVTPSKGFDASTNTNPYLCGNWGNVDCATMTEQAIHLGIPSFQLEIPPPMRKEIFYSEALCKKMAQAIYKIYKDVVVAWWPVKTVPLVADEELAVQVKNHPMKKDDFKKMMKDY